MMNIIVLVGTETSSSRTSMVVDILSKQLKAEFGERAQITIYNQEHIQAKHCIGCCSCFLDGKCGLDSKDNMEELKKALINADLIYMVSPVYFHQVSGTMKVFIDRLSYWTHLLRLVGKVAVTVSVSSTNGNEYVNFYLNKFLSHLGTIVIDDIALLLDLESNEEICKKIVQSIQVVNKKMNSLIELKPNQKQEIYFKVMQEQYKNVESGFEMTYWRNNDYFNYSTFDELWKIRTNKAE